MPNLCILCLLITEGFKACRVYRPRGVKGVSGTFKIGGDTGWIGICKGDLVVVSDQWLVVSGHKKNSHRDNKGHRDLILGVLRDLCGLGASRLLLVPSH